MRKAPALILQFVSLKLLEMSRVDCYVVRRFLKTLLEVMILVTLLVYCCEFM